MSSPAIAAGSTDFKRVNRAMAFGGFSTFALLYSVQPLMPLLARDFALTPAQSSLALSISTARWPSRCSFRASCPTASGASP